MFSFPHVDAGLWYWYIILKVNTTKRGLNLKNALRTLCLRGWGFHAESDFFFDIFSGELYFDVLIKGLY